MDNAYYMAALSLAFLVLLRYFLPFGKNKNKLPPSPLDIPFFGHLHLVEKPFHAKIFRLASLQGPIFSFRLGFHDTVVVSSLALAKECFTERDIAFADRPSLPSMNIVALDGVVLTTASYGPHWRTLRLVAVVHLLSAHRVNAMGDVISAEVRAMVVWLRCSAKASPRVQLKRRLFELSLSILMETIADTKTTRGKSDGNDDVDTYMSVEARLFKKEVDQINMHIGTTNLWDYLPFLQWFDVFNTRYKIGRRFIPNS